MKIEYTPSQAAFADAVKIFAKERVQRYAAQIDQDACIPPQVIQAIIDEGYIGSMISEEYGGMGADSIKIGILNEIIGGACSSTRGLLTVHGMVSLALQRWGTPQQKNNWLPKLAAGQLIGAFALTEPNVGSDAKSVETTATETKGGFLLSGTKKWITMGQLADLFLIFAQFEGKVAAFLLEKGTPGLQVQPLGGLIGARGSMIAELNLNQCEIPKENMVGKPGAGLSHVALPCLDYGRYTIACGNVGLAQACLEVSVQYSRKRKQFGEPLRKFQLIQKQITEMIVGVEAGRLLCQKAGCLRDAGDPDSVIQVWIAKYHTSLMANQVANAAVQIHGANGCSNNYPVERYLRDAKVSEIIEGTTQMHETMIATNSIRKY